MTLKSFTSFLDADPRFDDLRRFDPETGDFHQLTFQDHYAEVSAINLERIVPPEIRNCFDRARSVMGYSFFDYELFVVGEIQAFGSFELALKFRLDGRFSGSVGTLRNLVERARKHGVLPREPEGQLQLNSVDGLIQMRNWLSHGTTDVHTPEMALTVLKACAYWIDYIQSEDGTSAA